MDIKIILDASPALQAVLEKIAAALTPGAKAQAPIVEMGEKPKKEKAKPEPPAEVPAIPVTTTDIPASAGKDVTTDLTLEVVRERATAVARSGKKDAVKALLVEFGVNKIPALAPDQYPMFMEKLAAV